MLAGNFTQKPKAMNTRSLLLTISSLFFILFFVQVSGQTVVTGHVSAEVVEAVSASSSVSTDFDLSFSNSDRTLENAVSVAENLSLGTIHISSGQNVACNLTVKPATMTDEKGNDFSVEPITSFSGKQESQRVDGSQTIEIAGMARLNSNQASGLYHGSYTLVFAYN
jgi:hypothetical protein